MISKNQISLAGEFAVLSQLALKGFDANLTLGNTKSVDILVSNPSTGTMRKLEVKTHINNRPWRSKDFGYIQAQWRMNKKQQTIIDPTLFYCFVSIAQDTQSFNFYIVPSATVADFLITSHKYYLSTAKKKPRKDSDLRAFMLGRKGQKYFIKTPLVEEYENRWDLLH